MSVIINGDTGITTPAETVQGALTTTGNTILGDASTDTLNVGNGGLVKDASGNVGIGTASPGAKLDVAGELRVYPSTTPAVIRFGVSAVEKGKLAVDSSSNMLFETAGAERMRIDSSGNLLVGTTSVQSSAKVSISGNNSSSADASFITLQGTAENIGWINYDNAFGTMVRLTGTKQAAAAQADEGYFSVRTAVNSVLTGGVYIQNGGTSWTAISDERLKTDLKPIEGAVEKVVSLRAFTGRYKTDSEDVSRAFLIAQDVQFVLPEAVSETEQDGETVLGVAYTDVIPLLVAAIKEQQALIIQLQADVATLKALSA